MPRAYIPLKTIPINPPTKLQFSNGTRLVSRDEFEAADLSGWKQVFSWQELRDINEWHLAIACDWNPDTDLGGKTSPETRLANARIALQVAAPVGTFFTVCIREQDDGKNLSLAATRFEQLHGTPWSRMKGFNGITSDQIQLIVDGTIQILDEGNPRTVTPIRLFEQGLITRDPYLRTLFWVTAMDSILMAVKKELFLSRLYAMLGADTQVFPPEDGIYIQRDTRINEVAKDMFELRSLLAHGRVISKKFWEPRDDLANYLDRSVYNPPPRYRILLEEASLSLLSRMLHKIFLENLVRDFSNEKIWKNRLASRANRSL
jgi:hypothetical protein